MFEIVVHLVLLSLIALCLWKMIRDNHRKFKRVREYAASIRDCLGNNKWETDYLYDQMPCAIMIVSPSFTIQSINKELTKLTGADHETSIGRQCYNVFGKGQICENCPVEKTLQTRAVQQNIKYELTRHGKEIYNEQTAIPVFNEDGSVKHIFEVVLM